MDRRRRVDRQPIWIREISVNRILSLSAAVLTLAACSEATSPNSDLSTSEARPSSDPVIAVAGNLTNDTYTFENLSITGASGTSWAADQLTDGSFGISSPPTTTAYNGSTTFLGRADNTSLFLIV